MVLADSSVWVKFAANRAPHSEQLQTLLQADEVAGHELVYGELLIGDVGGRSDLLLYYQRLPRAGNVFHGEVVSLVRGWKLHGRGISWIDAHLIASAMVSGFQLWAADLRLMVVADELGVGYHPLPR